ncbi:cytochrome P450 [Desarmillaria tabescens]|uniref:Cytochrome P450 n=1 Tax=Armillaria tabescens TaxID=1929756 RepID=A0AA39NPP9_ARMTA|nr:cytochrome P450 [Desarmillaria tabescens]KAK0469562.1 cytochrome P450 [Desarmillaria tabescens]
MDPSLLPVSLSFGIFLLCCWFYLSRNRRRVPLPPGPRGFPLVGSLWNAPVEYPWVTYAQWTATYGDVLYLDIPGNPTVVINSAQAAVNLLEKRSGNYSDRPDFTMIQLAGWDFNLGFMRYSEQWRMHRRMFHQYFQLRAVPEYYPAQMKATSVLLQQIYSGSVIMKTVYGYDVNADDDKFVELADRAQESASEGWFPGASFLGLADTWRKDILSVVLSTILVFLLHPEIQTKVQAELDAVVGYTRLPNFEDRLQLPYIEAILLEALRWNPVLPLGVAHRSLKDDVYRGYYIPADYLESPHLDAQCRAILHDERDYPNPMVFDPDRFMPGDGKQLQPNPTAAFGFRRRCDMSWPLFRAWIAIASMASTLSFSKAVDSEGSVIEPSATFTDGLLSFPAPFKCTIKARSAEAQAVINSGGL